MTTNAERCALASAAVASYRHAGGGDPEDRAGTLGDLLTDVLHLIYEEAADDADEARGEVERLHARAWRNFTAELHEQAREAADVAAMDAERTLSRAGASGGAAAGLTGEVHGPDVQDALAEIGVQLESPEQYAAVARSLSRGEASVANRLEYLRGELRAERLSYGDLAELQALGQEGRIPADDLELREAAGLPEQEPESDYVNREALATMDTDALAILIVDGGPADLIDAARAELARRLRAAEADGDMDAVAEVENALAGLLGLDAEQGLTEAAGAAISAFRDAHDPVCSECGREIEPHASGLCESCEQARRYDLVSLEPLSFDTMGEDELRQLAKDLYAALTGEQLQAFHSARGAS